MVERGSARRGSEGGKTMTATENLAHVTRRLLEYLERPEPGVVKYEFDGGNAIGKSLMNEVDVAVQRCHVPAGVTFVAHIHNEREHVILYRGRAIVRVEGQPDVNMKVGDAVDVPPNVAHTFEALEDCWVIGVTVPASPVYPK